MLLRFSFSTEDRESYRRRRRGNSPSATWLGTLLWLAALLAAPGQAQNAGFPFQIRAQQGPNAFNLPNAAPLNLAADAIGVPLAVNVTVTYRGATTVQFSAEPQVVGSADFTVASAVRTTFPLRLGPGGSYSFRLEYKPSTSAQVQAQLDFGYIETATPPVTGNITLSLTGTAPSLTFSYFFQRDGNVLPIAAGSRIQFPNTPVNTTSAATVVITNSGTAPTTVTSISVSGVSLTALGLPLLPARVAAGSEVRFGVQFAPQQVASETGQLNIAYATGSIEVQLAGSGVNSAFAYDLLGSRPVPISPGGTIRLQDTAVGGQTTVTVGVRNAGTAAGAVSGLGLSGPAFAITEAPGFPATLAPNDVFTFTLVFAPKEPGPATGRLRIGNDVFDLAGAGIGPRLDYSYELAGSEVSLTAGGTIIFSPVQMGSSARLTVRVRNTGTAPATVSSMVITGGARGSFSLDGMPPLPARLEPSAGLGFALVFNPEQTGVVTSTLLIDARTFTISGVGSPPPDLPPFRFTGAAGQVDALQQPAVGLSLAEPYALAVKGLLTLTIDSQGFGTDSAVQFATGGRIVAFTIPAGSLEAVFSNGQNTIRFQTGTSAATLTFTPAFATVSDFDLTPSSPTPLRLSVPETPPRLVSVQAAITNANGLTIAIAGYATTRSLDRLDLRFAFSSDVNIPNPQVSLDVRAQANLWFGGSQSQGFGGQFFVTIPFTVQADTGALASPVQKLQSVTVTASNSAGVSPPVSSDIR